MLLLLLLTLVPLHHAAAPPNSDMAALLSFKAASDPSTRLSSWNPASDYCTWLGVSCAALNDQRRVSRLVLDGLNLTGTLLPLSPLTHLRVLSLNRNLLSGPLPDFFSSSFPSLKLLFLSHNSFSGGFPPSLTSLFRLYRLDLSHNNLSGPVPATLHRLYHLLTLRLEDNRFVGSIAGINLPNLQDLNVSGNLFAGAVPAGLSAFPPSAFDRNLALCGPPLPVCQSIVSDPSRPGGPGSDAAAAVAASPANATAVVPSTSTLPSDHPRRGGKLNRLAVVLIVVGDVVVLAAISGFLLWYFWRASAARVGGKRSRLQEGEKIVYSSSPYPPQGGLVERGKMVFFQGMKQFELEDLLRASAEMLGKGGFGTAYKAVLEDGSVVAVKRLKDLQPVTKREFEQQLDVLGRLRHPNLVPLMAYYYARDEKLLVYEYMANGSLFSLLHGTLLFSLAQNFIFLIFH